jgi:prepilin-type N-terminal cleavage/methylation domain-containing protein
MRSKQSKRQSCAGMTLIEVMTAAALLSLLSAGLFGAGIAVLRVSQFLRVTAEARAMAKERMETLTAGGRFRMTQGTYEALNTTTNTVTLDHPTVRRVQVLWHDADGNPAGPGSNAYAEIHVDVEYFQPLSREMRTDSYSVLVR